VPKRILWCRAAGFDLAPPGAFWYQENGFQPARPITGYALSITCPETQFQSAPRPRGRGDAIVPICEPRPSSFNPRPAHAGGATGNAGHAGDCTGVSIRDPPTRAGRQTLGGKNTATCQVSIRAPPTRAGRRARAREQRPNVSVSIRAPPTRAGRPTRVFIWVLLIGCFNPRPAHAGGATERLAPTHPCAGVSIRAPPTRAGRPVVARVHRQRGQVSIRAPPTRAGRHGQRSEFAEWIAFQSAPRPRGRGDPAVRRGIVWKALFQSAPRPRGRGDSPVSLANILCRSFNPRPAHAGGATRSVVD
jgi:hypothetical protein